MFDDLIAELEAAAEGSQEVVIYKAVRYAHDHGWIDDDTFVRACQFVGLGAFVDAALTLVPEGYGIESFMIWPNHPSSLHLLETQLRDGEYYHDGGKHGRWQSKAATSALAICIAALKARNDSHESSKTPLAGETGQKGIG